MPQRILHDGTAETIFVQQPGQAQLLVSAFGSGTLTLQASVDATTWVDSDVNFTAVGIKKFDVADGYYYRVNATDLTGFTAHMAPSSPRR